MAKKQRKRNLVLARVNNINIPYLQKIGSVRYRKQLLKLEDHDLSNLANSENLTN